MSKHKEDESQQQQSISSKTLTLESQNPQISNHPHPHQIQEPDQSGMKKLETLSKNFKPIPFLPNKTLDFPTHEKLLKRIGLWDFVHVEFECDIRTDLLTQLIVNFDPRNQCSYINDNRISVSCDDLARALKLPLLKTKKGIRVMEKTVLDHELIVFVEDLVSNWILLHDNTLILPKEILNWTRVIREGHPERVDWASLMWFMVERELAQGSGLGHCYYASHLQCLIKSQHEFLFLEKPIVVDNVVEDDDVCEVDLSEDDGVCAEYEVEGQNNELSLGRNRIEIEHLNHDCGMDFEGKNIELSIGQNGIEVEHLVQEYGMDFEGQNTELSLGQNRIEVEHLVQDYGRDFDGQNIGLSLGYNSIEVEHLGQDYGIDFEECEEHEPGKWPLNSEENVGEHFLQRCRNRGLLSDEEEEDDQVHGQEQQEAIDSTNVFQKMELQDHSLMEQFASSPSLFSNVHRKEIDHDHYISRQSLNDNHKRPRSDDEDSDFDLCMENIHNWVGKAKMLYHGKEQYCTDLNVNQEMINELQQRDDMIEYLQKVRFEEQQKRKTVVDGLERELYGMGKLLVDYRKALKETSLALSEYRLKHEEEEMMKRVKTD